MELYVERAVVEPRRVELRGVLVDEVSVLSATRTAKVLHLLNTDRSVTITIQSRTNTCA